MAHGLRYSYLFKDGKKSSLNSVSYFENGIKKGPDIQKFGKDVQIRNVYVVQGMDESELKIITNKKGKIKSVELENYRLGNLIEKDLKKKLSVSKLDIENYYNLQEQFKQIEFGDYKLLEW